MSIFGPVPGMWTMRFRAKSLAKHENGWFSACPPRIAKNVPTVFAFYFKNALEKVDAGLRSPNTRPLKPHLSSGNAENELPEPRIEDNVSGQISKKTCENVWFSSHFEESEKSEQKRA